MSIELPEAKILAEQMNKELNGKTVKSYSLKNYEKLQKIGMIDKNIKSFNMLVNEKIKSVTSRGNVILTKLTNNTNLILAPEYGGNLFYHPSKQAIPKKYHLKVNFSDNTSLTVKLASMGLIHAMKDSNLEQSYVYRRDFNPKISSPIDEVFTFEEFSKLLINKSRMLKSVLVGKEAIIVGISNSAFQDIIYKAKLHPKRKASELNKDEKQALYSSIKLVLRERIRLKGKDQFFDLYGKQGNYTPTMGPNMKQKHCPTCKSTIEKLSVGGGQVYICPKCQI